MGKIIWEGKDAFTVDGELFSLVGMADDHSAGGDRHPVFKPRWVIQRYEEFLARIQPKLILELGIYQGGSSVFFHRLTQPEKLVAVELSTDRVVSLDKYIETTAGDSMKAHYGINQASAVDVERVLQEEFGSRQLDLVLDDASHFLEETSSSFNQLFPRLRPGGVYVIEDWSWAHRSMGKHPPFSEKEPLTKLVLEIVMACSSRVGLIGKIEIDRNSASIWRGKKPINEENFDVARCVAEMDRSLTVTEHS